MSYRASNIYISTTTNVISFATIFLNVIWAIYLSKILINISLLYVEYSNKNEKNLHKLSFLFDLTSIASVFYLLISPFVIMYFVHIMSDIHIRHACNTNEKIRAKFTILRKKLSLIFPVLFLFWTPVFMNVPIALALHSTLFLICWFVYITFVAIPGDSPLKQIFERDA